MERVTEGAAEGAVGPGTHRVLRIVHISSRKKLLVAAIAYRVSRLCVADCGRGSDLRRTAHCALCLRIVCCGRGGSLEAGCVLRIAFAHCVRAVVQRAAYCVLRLRIAYGQLCSGLRIAYCVCVLRTGSVRRAAYCVLRLCIAYGQCEAGCVLRIAFVRCVRAV